MTSKSFEFRNWKTYLYGNSTTTTSDGKYKLAIQNLSNAYRLISPSSKSADDFDNRILKLREQHNSEEDIYAECIGILADCVCCADWLDC